uniref:URB1 ribosome biogenesis homolog n=1 Tax=Salarias fasciatus TaxID=181472 RepID=A0A672FZC2_SALFA
MDIKRRSDASANSDAPAKKGNFTEFNGTEFKAMLKEPTTAMKGLEKFISTSKRLPRPGVYDVVEGYIKISVECAEIFKLLEGEKQVEREMLLIFESLEAILLRTASDLSHFRGVGSAIVKKIVSSHMKLLQTSFHAENHRFVRQCLSLLSALVSQGPEAAREVFSHLHISRTLSGLAKRKDKKGRPDVRLAFIQFVLSFLVAGDNATVGQILEKLLPEILSTGLKEDRMSTVNLILSTLKSRVVLNKGISKTQKVRFFTPAVLDNIASLYKWNGIVDVSTGDRVEGDSQLSGISVVRDLTHNFLLELCCSRKHGISFHDASFGTAGRAGNIVLLQFLVGLKQATEDELVAELVVNMLKESPDILSRYFKETQHSYTPRLKSAWQDNVKFLKKIYEAQPDISTIFQGRETIPLPRLLSMILVVSLPPVCNKAFFSHAVGLANTAAQLTTLSMMTFLLKRANKNIEYLLDKSVWNSSDVYRVDMMEELAQQYRETLSKILPDMTSIVSKWQSLSKKEKTTSEEKGAKPEAVILLKALILQVICLYQKVVPHLVSQCKFDFSKLLKGIVSEKGMREEVPPMLQQQILQLALDLPASKFSWFRIQGGPEQDLLSGEKSVLYLLLKMFVSSSHLKTSTQRLVLKVLKDSGVFEYTWTELELWLDHLTRLHSDQQETIIQFLEKVLVKLVCNSHTYTDKVASLVQEAGLVQANLSNAEGDAASIAVSHIDDVLDMLDVIMEGNDGEMEDFGPSLTEDLIIQTFPFSVLVPAALEARNKLPADKGVVHEYLCAVLSDVLHCQRDPLPLCLALLQYDKELESSELCSVTHLKLNYSENDGPSFSFFFSSQFKSSECHLEVQTAPSQYTAVMKAAYIQGPGSFLEEGFRKNVEDALTSMSMEEFPVAIKQILLYIRATVESFGTVSFPKDVGASYLRTLTEMLQDLVTRLQGFQESKEMLSVILLFQVLVSALGSIFKHPCLEQWFLALELSSLPAHSLKPVRLKRLCAQMSDSTVALLKIGGPTLSELGRLDLVGSYMASLERAALGELTENSSQPAQTHSRTFQALLALHSFMDPCSLREVVSKLLLLPQHSLISSSREGKQSELSIYGQAALQILTECKWTSSQENDTFLTQAHLHGLSTLLLSCSSPALEAFLLQTLSSEPASAQLVHTDVLLHCLRADGAAVSSLLLQHSSTHRLRFEEWCLKPAHMEKISQEKENFLPLINTYLQDAGRDDPARPKDEEVLKALKKALLASLSQCVLGDLTGESAAPFAGALSSLIRLASKVKDIKDLISNLPSALQNTDTFERWQLVDVINEKLADCPEESEKWRKSVATAAVKCLIASYSQSKDQASSPSDHEHSILKRLQQILVDISASEWNSFVKTGLKYRYHDEQFLSTLRRLLDRMYAGSDVEKDLIPLSTVHMMTSSHSLFLPTMLDAAADSAKSQIRNSYCFFRNMKETKSAFLLCRSFMWGPAAVEHHKTRKSLGASLWKQASSDDVLALLKTDRMLQTIQNFPQQRRIFPQDEAELLYRNDAVKDPGTLYDPCFLLPLFSVILQPECVVDCLKFVSSHALGATVAALSSYDPKVRAAAYHVLGCFYHHLEGARFREKRQLLYLMDMVKNGVRQQNQRLPFVLTTYVAKVAQLMLKPEDHMYVVLNRFLLSHQSLDFRRVPEFFKLFYGFDLEHKMAREWILGVLEEGISDGHCYGLCSQQGIFQVLLGFSSSPLCDEHFQNHNLILEPFHSKAARVTKAAYNLIRRSSLLTWMIQVVEKRNVDRQLLGAVIQLLHVLWFTVLSQKEKQADREKSSSSSEENAPSSVKCLSLPFITEFLSVASAICRQLRSGVKAADLLLLLQTVSSVLKHRETALSVNRQAERLSLAPQPLSCTDTLSLLLCWAQASRCTALLAHIQALSEKHKLKELTGRYQPSSSLHFKEEIKRLFFRVLKAILAEDSEMEKQEQSALADCKLLLGGIFAHWEPVILLSEQRDQLVPSQLACDTAHLLTKWSLRCLVEQTYDESRAKEFLHWVQKSVLKHGEILDAVWLDPGWKADLLRLYHRVLQAQSPSSISAGAETLQIFTDIMICFLETRGGLPELHRVVVSAAQQQSTRGKSDPRLALTVLELPKNIEKKKKIQIYSKLHKSLHTYQT